MLFGASPYYAELHDRTFSALRTLFDHALDVRRCGSAALDLCMIADGRAEVVFEMRLCPGDYAAGLLIVREGAGGVAPRWKYKYCSDAAPAVDKAGHVCYSKGVPRPRRTRGNPSFRTYQGGSQ